MSNCRFNKLAYLYSGGMLESGEIERFEAHMAECAQCRRVVEEENEIRSLYSSSEIATPAPGLEEKILAGLNNDTKRQTYTKIKNDVVYMFAKRLVPIAACFAAILFVAVLFTKPAIETETVASSGFSYIESQLTETELELLSSDSTEAYYELFDFSESI